MNKRTVIIANLFMFFFWFTCSIGLHNWLAAAGWLAACVVQIPYVLDVL